MIRYIDRVTKKEETEKVYGEFLLKKTYGKGLASHFLRPLFAKIPLFSHLYGWLQKSGRSRAKVEPFIEAFHVDVSEFRDPVSSYRSFNDFFIRHLKPECRPFAAGDDVAILPADARYLVYPRLDKVDGFLVKGRRFSLEKLLQNPSLADRYKEGAMVIARLCPVDYHRFHFPCDCTPGQPRLINGPLYSVNPIALKYNIDILTENKRVITPLSTKRFGTIQYIDVGATCVGSIKQTFTPGKAYAKGDEKGYFEFGGSCLILLFEPGTLQIDQDLLEASERKIEMRALLGQSLGKTQNA